MFVNHKCKQFAAGFPDAKEGNVAQEPDEPGLLWGTIGDPGSIYVGRSTYERARDASPTGCWGRS